MNQFLFSQQAHADQNNFHVEVNHHITSGHIMTSCNARLDGGLELKPCAVSRGHTTKIFSNERIENRKSLGGRKNNVPDSILKSTPEDIEPEQITQKPSCYKLSEGHIILVNENCFAHPSEEVWGRPIWRIL